MANLSFSTKAFHFQIIYIYKLAASFRLNICFKIQYQLTLILRQIREQEAKKQLITNNLHQEFNNIYTHIYIYVFSKYAKCSLNFLYRIFSVKKAEVSVMTHYFNVLVSV